MGDARLSQLPIEIAVVSDATIQLRLSQLPIEVAVVSNVVIEMRLSQIAIEVMVLEAPASTEQIQLFIVS